MQDLKIRQKCEDMIEYGYAALKQFPRSEKHTLAAEIKRSMFRLLELIIATNKKYYKKTTMQQLDVELDILRSYIRLARNLGFLPFKKYEVWSRYLTEIGKMIGGWFKYINSK
ncbi:MAG: hypothetical protein PWR10_1524 [Halanaerobiales bacterium]|nr:hypothetical protein [Halanaerobiales bacterium]